MSRIIKSLTLAAACLVVMLVFESQSAQGQVVTTYYGGPVVSYMPVRYGVFGLRTAYAPVVSYPAPMVTGYYAPAPVTTYYSPAVTSYYVAPAPVTTYYVSPAPIRTYYRPLYIPY